MAGLSGLLGNRLLQGTREVDTASVKSGVVALYFSAHWCPPCRQFTPEFGKVYRRCKEQGKSFEVVFVSADREEASFREYFAHMPWHALPFADRARKETLSATYGVRGIPTVVLLSSSGEVLDMKANGKVMAPSFPSTLPRVVEVEADVDELPPDDPVCVEVRSRGQSFEIECLPEDGWELLRTQIFSVTEVAPEQQRLFGLGAEKGLLSEAIPLPRALALGRRAQRGAGLPLAEVPEAARSASSVLKGEAPGIGNNRGRLDSPQSWSALGDDPEPWYQMDLGAQKQVAGVVIACRRKHPQWVERFKVSFAIAAGAPWQFVEAGKEFEGNSTCAEPPKRVLFPSPVSACRVRIHPTKFHNHCSLRADVILGNGAAAAPDPPPRIVVLGNFSADDPFEFLPSTPGQGKDETAKLMEEQHLAFLQAKLSSLPPKLQSQAGSLQHVKRYEELPLQRQALDQLPVEALDGAAAESPGEEAYELAFMRQVLLWFKHSFFTWTNKPKCEHCGATDTQPVEGTGPTQLEQQYGAGRVEVVKCNKCGGMTRFPRYNDPSKLLEFRTGRCGEWANCFTLVCRALGYEARHVHDWTDHVWTEVYSDSLKRWVPVDSCEAALDKAMMYEKGWGKKLTYCLAFARDHVCDVSKRYTRNFEVMLTRRTAFPEQQLERCMAAISEFALESALAKLPPQDAEARRLVLTSRAELEAKEFAANLLAGEALKEGEEVGRTSGDKEWREQRGELGATSSAREQAISCSVTGIVEANGSPKAASIPGSWYESAEDADLKDGVLTANLRRCDGSMNRCSVTVEAGASYSNIDGNFEVEDATQYRLQRLHSTTSSDTLQEHAAVTLPSHLKEVCIKCRWQDQGFGNQKGELLFVTKRGQQVLNKRDLFGLAPHEWRSEASTCSAADLGYPQPGDTLAVQYNVGGGGGHKLTVEDLSLVVHRDFSLPAAPQCPTTATAAAAPAPAPASAAAAASPAPAAAAPGPAKQEDVKDQVKAEFAKLVAAGMPPNEAAAAAIQNVKGRMAFQPPARGT